MGRGGAKPPFLHVQAKKKFKNHVFLPTFCDFKIFLNLKNLNFNLFNF